MQAKEGAAARREAEAAEAGAIIRSTGDRVEAGFWDTLDGLLLKIPHLLAFVAAVVAAWLLGRTLAHLVAGRMSRRNKRDLGRLLGTVLHWLTVLVVALFGVTILIPAIDPAHVLSVLGIGSVAIGFVFKDILQNLLSGIIILVREPYTRGDEIEVDGCEGVVEEVETRATHIRTIDQRLVTIPNSMVFSNTVTVNTNLPYRLSSYTLSIAYGGDPRHAMEVALDAVRSVEGVFPEPAPRVALQALNDYSIDLLLTYAAGATAIDQIETRGQVLLAIHDACRANGIELPFPTQVTVLRPYKSDGSDPDKLTRLEGREPKAPQDA